MELWVRSQDKDSLIKPKKIELIYDYLCGEDIQLIHIETDKGRIGSYSTKERALEVLDEIQKKINLINLGHDFGSPMIDLENPTYIYEMPKE